MAYEQQDNSGSIFLNEKKETAKHPDRTGSAMIDGVEYWVNGWLKKKKDGQPYLSLSFKPKQQKRKQDPISTGRRPPGRNDDMNDEIPF